ncbi:MAG: HDOD domain-containing protein [Pyrinomonadaceae bacterium]|nr:HDOD domain-containing protein [Pyrinomonadaceae bacterium]
MIKIMFVDDDPNILNGIRRMLRTMREEWSISLSGGGVEALEVMQQQPFDVIVSDMRMPGMDGAELLNEVRQRFPHVARIILSGYSEQKTILKSVGAAHQYLAKPCDSELLKSTVQRVYELREFLENPKLRSLLSKLHSVPSLPSIYSELLDELQNEEPSIKKISAIIKQDIGMSVKILQLVNSAFFGLRREISDINNAVEYLGLETIRSLALALCIFTKFGENQLPPGLLTKLWAHSSTIGTLSRRLALMEDKTLAQNSFTAGLLHDIGRVLLATNLPKEFLECVNLSEKQGMRLTDAEVEIFGASHAEVGAYLLGLWGLPESVVQAVAYHHQPSRTEDTKFSVLSAVHFAEALVEARDETGSDPGSHVDNAYLDRLGMREKWSSWQTAASEI